MLLADQHPRGLNKVFGDVHDVGAGRVLLGAERRLVLRVDPLAHIWWWCSRIESTASPKAMRVVRSVTARSKPSDTPPSSSPSRLRTHPP